MADLIKDIKESSAWLITAFQSLNITLDYSMDSVKYIDAVLEKEFIEGKPRPNGLFVDNLGGKLFAIGAYVGEVIVKNANNSFWKVNNDDPHGEINATIVGDTGWEVWPMQRVMKRIQNGSEDALGAYVQVLLKDYLNKSENIKKPKWKFW